MARDDAPSTSVERGQECTLLLVTVANAFIAAVFVLSAVTADTLSLIGESFRWIFIGAVQINHFLVFYFSNRRRFDRFEFGTAKLEQMVHVVLGAGLLVGSLWMVNLIFEVLIGSRDAARPANLAVAALVNAIGLLAGWISCWVMWRNLPRQRTVEFEEHLRSRATMLVESFGLLFPLTAAAFSRDVGVGVAFDLLGATYLTILMFRHGLRLLNRSIPHVLDSPASTDEQFWIADVVETLLPAGDEAEIRTRLNGNAIEVEIAIDSGSYGSAAELCRQAAMIENALPRQAQSMDVFVTISKAGGSRVESYN